MIKDIVPYAMLAIGIPYMLFILWAIWRLRKDKNSVPPEDPQEKGGDK